jgi:transposase
VIKHSEQFKLKVVEHYLVGTMGYTLVAAQHGIVASMVRRWVAAYRLHGTNGLCRKVQRYTATFKLSVLQHMWENALTYNQTAAAFNIRNPTSVGIWNSRYREGGFEALARQSRNIPEDQRVKASTPSDNDKPDDQRSREELMKELAYLRMENEVLKKLQALVQERKKLAPKKRK